MVESALKKHPEVDIGVLIVWIPMLPSDNRSAAEESGRMFDDPRVHQFWDENRLAGIAYSRDLFPRWAKNAAESLPPDDALCESLRSRADAPPEKRPLWDVAFFYPTDAEWDQMAPKPIHWTKQIVYFGKQSDGTSGLFYRNEFAKRPFASDWFDEVKLAMEAVMGE